MASSCILYPQVQCAGGEWRPSGLFRELAEKYGRDKAKDAYLMVRGANFDTLYDRRMPDGSPAAPEVSVEGRHALRCDANGEPLMEELEGLDDFRLVLGADSATVPGREAELNQGGPKEASRANIDAADERAARYNAGKGAEDGMVAFSDTSFDTSDGVEYVTVRVVRKGAASEAAAAMGECRRRLNDRLKGILSSWGIGVGSLDKTERMMRVNGVTDFAATRLTAEGLVEMIRLAKGRAGDEALPEEFCHIAVEAMKDSPLMSRLFALVRDKGLARAILGDAEYDAYMEAYKAGREDADSKAHWKSVRQSIAAEPGVSDAEAQVIYEAIGKLVADKVLLSYGVEGVVHCDADTLMERVKGEYRDRFGAFDEGEILSAMLELDRGASDFARYVTGDGASAMAGRVKAVASSRKYYQMEQAADRRKEVLGKLIENEIRRYKVLRSGDTGENMAYGHEIKLLQQQYESGMYELGICKFVSDAIERMRSFDEDVRDLAGKEIPLNMKAKRLKRARNFVSSYKCALKLINEARFGGVISLDTSTTETIMQLTNMVDKLQSNIRSLSDPLFVKWISQFVGDGVVVPFGKRKGESVTARQLATKGSFDISMSDRWLDSMAESGDLVLRMMDAETKRARASARAEVLKFKERIDAAYSKLRAAGYSDTDFMHERLVGGGLSGEYISYEEAARLPDAQREFHAAFMRMKRQLDNMLPTDATHLTNMIRIRKDLVERLRGKTANETWREVVESVKDTFMRRSDDSEFGGEKSSLVDFDGHPVERLPIYYIKSKDGESLDDLSTDACSSLLMYADMCCNYEAMDGVVGTLEMVRDKLRERPMQVRKGGRLLRNVTSAFGVTVKSEATVAGDNTLLIKRLDDWFESQVYGRYMKDEGEVLGVDKGKAANFVNYMTSLNQFAVNIMSGLSNLMTGAAMMHIEHAAGEFFTAKDTLKADLTFWREMKDYIGDVNNPVKKSKLALFNMKFNSLVNFEETVRSQEYGRSRVARFLSSDSLYFLNSAGELWLQSRCALSMAYHTKLLLNGEEVNLWDAYETVEEGGVTKLRLRDGITKLDGTAFTETDEAAFTNRAKAVNQRMNGIYNYEDRCAAQAYAVGRLALMFRKWIKTSLNRRYGNVRYNYDLESWEEGYYRTAGRFAMTLIKDIRNAEFHATMRWNELMPQEKANLRRALCESGMFIVVSIVFAMLTTLKHGGDGDDDDYTNTWWFNMTRYQVRRLEAEIGAMMPQPNMIDEALTILKSPAACLSPMEGLVDLTKMVWPQNWFTEIKSGKYKGHSKAYKYFWDSPLVPMQRTIYRGLHPENSIGFFDTE